MEQDKICPCCGIEEETLEHMFQCTNAVMTSEKNDCYGVIKTILKGTQRPIKVIEPFLEALQ